VSDSHSQLRESVFDALFKQAVIDNFYDELNLVTQNSDLTEQYNVSAAFEKRMDALFAKEKQKASLTTFAIWCKRVAAVVVITASILFSSLMLVPEVRAVVVETVIEWFEQFARFTSGSIETTAPFLEPVFIPDGFWEEYRYSDDVRTTILFINSYDVLLFFDASLSASQLSVDSEGHEYEKRQINNTVYHVLIAIDIGKENKIIWDIDGNRYFLSSEIPIEDLFQMALSLG
jgi:hypothetical protein